ncbi:c-type cytochrome [Methylobacterium flocculans]|uniref:c-type cytochrome n=1 Tax=Methylobacterium flocculans TaxID=2984843 RepID=UPI0021F33A34|nr:c-type cytochrome [Methylobacterium sp. FF17]
MPCRWRAVAALAAALSGCGDDGAERRQALGANPSLSDALKVASDERGGRLFGRCAACHTIKKGAGDRGGPGLFGVMGTPITGSSRHFAYTGALRSRGGIWSPDRMDAWLASPAKFAPGTSMTFPGIEDALDRADVIAYLRTQSDRSDAPNSHQGAGSPEHGTSLP